MLEIPQLTTNILILDLPFLLKGALLVLIAIYAIFTFFIYNKVRALNRIVFFPPRTTSNSIKLLSLIYFLIILSLFFLTLVIL
ncbi:hypothetical protein KJ980_04190 [Patescibacteria group bacterium]|nr:hypothetical protein [Patescibacteria group bacterium]MBU4016593.1 hypothetical protein [Patescibacteria group bacterium]MBU4098824.1 hypothetical protein [Patescibacteria group bacterium]